MSKYETYRHPLGVDCLTIRGFFQSEADKNGTTTVKEMEDFYKTMEEETEKDRQRILNDKDGLLESIKKIHAEYKEDNPEEPEPLSIVSIEDVRLNEGLRGSDCEIFCTALFNDNKEYKLRVWHNNSFGSFYEPPDEDYGYEMI